MANNPAQGNDVDFPQDQGRNPVNPNIDPQSGGQQGGYPQLQQRGQVDPSYQPSQVIPEPYQQVTPSPSPEVPARTFEGSGEYAPPVETSKEVQKGTEELQKKETGTEQPKESELIEAPLQAPDQKKFESPFSVYGYQVSSQIAQIKDKLKGDKPKGDVQKARTWLLLLLGRILKMSPSVKSST